jgi:hypothetical protein
MYFLPSAGSIVVSSVDPMPAPSKFVPFSVPKIFFAASPSTPTQFDNAADVDTPAGPGGAGQSWKKPLFTVMAEPVESLATLVLNFAVCTMAKNASLKGLCQYSLNSVDQKEKSNVIACAFDGTLMVTRISL